MKKISPERYVEGVNSIYEEQPEYEKGCDGSNGKCDCIGMSRGGLEREGVTDVTNMRGTNQAARKTIQDMQKIVGSPQLQLGDVVLKTRDKDDKNMPLPDRYRKGGVDYDPKWGETNFTHIGTVTRINPLEITHMTSPTAKKDYSLGNWSYFGHLPWVDKEADPDEPDEPTATWAKVWADSGITVKMRAKPSAKCKLYWDVPIGSQVVLVNPGDTWSEIIWAGKSGYMMSKFLFTEDGGSVPEPDSAVYTVTITGLTKEEAEQLCMDWRDATMKRG